MSLQLCRTFPLWSSLHFKACEDSAGYNAIDIIEGFQPQRYHGIAIALLIHGQENNMFELLEADDGKLPEFEESMASVIGVMRNKKNIFEKSISESTEVIDGGMKAEVRKLKHRSDEE
jgi:hypothetical protein